MPAASCGVYSLCPLRQSRTLTGWKWISPPTGGGSHYKVSHPSPRRPTF
jgi:hypothetical protein